MGPWEFAFRFNCFFIWNNVVRTLTVIRFARESFIWHVAQTRSALNRKQLCDHPKRCFCLWCDLISFGLSMSIFLFFLLICAIMHLFLCFLDVLLQDFFSLLLFVSFGKCCDFSSYNLLSLGWECPLWILFKNLVGLKYKRIWKVD